nr:ATP-binding protein [uncultured Cellulosilyticum sp.]
MSFVFYRNFNENKILNGVYALNEGLGYSTNSCKHQLGQADEIREKIYEETLSELLEVGVAAGLKQHLFKMYLTYLVARSENAFSVSCERDGEKIDEALRTLAVKDIAQVLDLWHHSPFDIELAKGAPTFLDPLYEVFENAHSAEEIVDYLVGYYKRFGAGIMNGYKAFKWDEKIGLVGIGECDPITFDQLIGCDYQKKALIKNTEAFLQGKEANNVLLFGDRGTGKSSSIKALLNAYCKEGLRVVELSKADFKYFNRILHTLRERGLKFILFLDDLSFEEFEVEYKYMKALIEGGIEVRPQNVLICATSNRRHLVKETWDDRQGQEINITDTRQEKLSLADRFGLSLTFTSPNQNLYLEMVYAIAKHYKVTLDENTLREKAIQWELLHGGRSGRTAKQFILSIL